MHNWEHLEKDYVNSENSNEAKNAGVKLVGRGELDP